MTLLMPWPPIGLVRGNALTRRGLLLERLIASGFSISLTQQLTDPFESGGLFGLYGLAAPSLVYGHVEASSWSGD